MIAESRRTGWEGRELPCRALFDQSRDAIALVTTAGIVLEVNRRWEELRGTPRESLIGTHIREAVVKHRQDNAVAEFHRLVAAGGGSTVTPIQGPAGSTVYLEFSTTRVDVDGEALVFTIGRDVTEAVEAKARLLASERKYRVLVDNIPDVVWTAQLDGKITFMNPRVENVCGFSAHEIIAAPATFWFDRIHPEDRARVREAFDELTTRGWYEALYRFQRKDDKWIWIRARALAALDADGDAIAEGTFADVTAARRLEDQVRQSQKLEAIGQLTGGIAHDFNNLLAIILGNGRMLLDELPGDDPRRADAEAVMEAGERAAALTRQLLLFSRRQILRPERLDMNTVVGGLEKMLRRVIGEDIDLSLGLSAGPAIVVADAGEIEQVVMNLVINARDAMPEGGHLTIETALVELDAEYAAAHDEVAPGEYLQLTVTDTGSGMDAETRRRAFEPFFTTKGKARGTGLGLSTCYGIVQRCRGHITVYSEPGLGSAFKVYLPSVGGQVRAVAAETPDARGTETILLVEDDSALRRTIHRVLEMRGYQVLDAATGSEAIAVPGRHGGAIHLVISDMVMPGLSGPDTVTRLLERRPALRVLYMSGYSDHALLRSGVGLGVHFIQKPFTPKALAAKVRAVLDE